MIPSQSGRSLTFHVLCVLFLLLVVPASAEPGEVVIIGPDGAIRSARASSNRKELERLTYADWEHRDRNQQHSIFLVAGGSDSANFAQEIVEQRRHFLQRGVPESEIVCFYARPSWREFNADRVQWLSLAEDLKPCYPASPKIVFEVLEEAGLAGTPRLYFYSSSHGGPPMSHLLKKKMLPRSLAADAEKWVKEMPFIDQYVAVYDSDEKGQAVDFFGRFLKYEEGTRARDILFTPRHFKEVLNRFWKPETPKVAVIQACYSGGFVDSDEEKHKVDTLGDVPNATVLTASKHDRGSFGCETGAETTYFGGEYNAVLKADSGTLSEIDWRSLYEEVEKRVGKKEADFRAKLSFLSRMSFKPSLPQFLQTSGVDEMKPVGADPEFDPYLESDPEF